MRRNQFCRGALRVSLASLLLAWVVGSCSPPVERLTGFAKVHDNAKVMFGRSGFDRSLEYATELARANPPTEFTERGQVVSVILMSGLAQGYKELAEGYRDGLEKLKNPSERPAYLRRRYDYYQYAKTRALQLAELSTRFIQAQEGDGVKDFTVELPYPAIEPPASNHQLQRVLEGMHLGDPEHKKAELTAIRMCVRRSLAGALGVEEGEVRAALESGSARISNVAFDLFLARQLVDTADTFGPKGLRENRTRVAVCDRADAVIEKALAILRANPDGDLKKVATDIQKDIETARKTSS